MKTFLILSLLFTSVAFGATLEELQTSFMTRYDEVNATRDEQLKKLEKSYLNALDRQMEKAKASGKLEEVLPVRDEMEAVRANSEALPKLAKSADRDLQSMRSKFSGAREKIVQSHASSLVELAAKMDRALEVKETELTKAGKIDAALAAKRMRETLSEDVGLQKARHTSKVLSARRQGRPMLRLSRNGDGIEVDVYLDNRGRISMESPIANVLESVSDDAIKLGDTKAKVLGEFVGAEGYRVDPFVYFIQEFDKKGLGAISLRDLEGKQRHQVEGLYGLRISIPPDAENSFIYTGRGILPPKELGVYRVSCSYFVPDSNKTITGFRFTQGSGGQKVGRLTSTRRGWVSGEFYSKSINESNWLLLFPHSEDGAPFSPEDYVVLGRLKVEQTSFSAYTVTTMRRDASAPDADKLEERQPYIVNGQFVDR